MSQTKLKICTFYEAWQILMDAHSQYQSFDDASDDTLNILYDSQMSLHPVSLFFEGFKSAPIHLKPESCILFKRFQKKQ